MQCCFRCNRMYSKRMRKKFKHCNHTHDTYTYRPHLFNYSMPIFKWIRVMHLAIAWSMLHSFATCLPASKRWKQKSQAKYLDACAKSRGHLCFFTVRAERNPITFFFCNMDPTRNAQSYGQHPVPPEHFPFIFQDRLTLQSLIPIKCLFS